MSGSMSFVKFGVNGRDAWQSHDECRPHFGRPISARLLYQIRRERADRIRGELKKARKWSLKPEPRLPVASGVSKPESAF